MNPTAKNILINIGSGVFLLIAVWFVRKFIFSEEKKPSKKISGIGKDGKIKSIKELTKMAIDEQNENFISKLHPKIQDKVRKLLSEWYNAGFPVRITSGFRSIPEQNKLYNQGRSKDSIAKKEPIVTWAIGGKSFHNYGLAIDVIRIINGKAMYKTPDGKDVDYSVLKPIAIKNGFEWGGDWTSKKDFPHFQYTFGKRENDLLALYNSGKKSGEYVNIV